MAKSNGPSVKPVYRRVLLKISGEGLAGQGGFGIGADSLTHVAHEVKSVSDLGVQVGIVVGGFPLGRQNFFVG